jgi:pre-mRNA-processing factor 6
MPPGRYDFLSQQAPENYVAGLGRGATGFTTRSDLGPARSGPSEDQIKEALAKRAAQLGLGPDGAKPAADEEKDDEPDRYDQDPDNEVGLFSGGQYDRDDDEADRIYQEVDEKMDKRRRIRRLVHILHCTFSSSSCHPHKHIKLVISTTFVSNRTPP